MPLLPLALRVYLNPLLQGRRPQASARRGGGDIVTEQRVGQLVPVIRGTAQPSAEQLPVSIIRLCLELLSIQDLAQAACANRIFHQQALCCPTQSSTGILYTEIAQLCQSINDRNAILAAVQQNGLLLQYVGKIWQNDHDIVLAAVKQNGLALQFAGDRLYDKTMYVYDIVLAAVQQNGLALQFVGERINMRRMPEIVLAAVTQNGLALQFVGDRLYDQMYDIVLAAVTQNGLALQFVGDRIDRRRMPEIVLAAVTQNGLALQFAPLTLRNLMGGSNLPIAIAALRQNGMALQFIKRSRRDQALVLIAIEQNEAAFQFAGNTLQNDHDFALEAIQKNRGAIEFIGESLKTEAFYAEVRLRFAE